MTELLTAAQMRAIEAAAIDSGAVTGLELMEHAGQGVVEAVFQEWPEFSAPPVPADAGGAAAVALRATPPGYLKTKEGAWRAVVLCGPGNNGGDGFVIARLLRERGWEVEVFLYGDPEKLPPDARVNYERWCGMGEVRPLDESAPCFAGHPDLAVDAIFGTGLTRPLSGHLLEFARDMNECRPVWRDVAVDVPSGLNSDTGQVMGAAFPAELTVTFHREKIGHRLAQGPETCGRVVVKDIGL